MKAEVKKKKIIKIAFELFLEKGYEATTVRTICSKCKIESPTLYYYFKSKKGLFFAVIDDILIEYQKLLKEFSIDGEVDGLDKLHRFFVFSIYYARNHEKETKFYLRNRLFRPDELKKDHELHMKETYQHKKDIYMLSIQACINDNLITINEDEAFERFTNFIDSCTFNIIFSEWRPSDERIEAVWKSFVRHELN
jgi:AcrR family transcriptional regulator